MLMDPTPASPYDARATTKGLLLHRAARNREFLVRLGKDEVRGEERDGGVSWSRMNGIK